MARIPMPRPRQGSPASPPLLKPAGDAMTVPRPHAIMRIGDALIELVADPFSFTLLLWSKQDMVLGIRDVEPHELDAVLAINNAAGPTILPLDAAALRAMYEQTCYFRMAEIDGRIAGFLPAMREDSDYASTNFRWFRDRYPEFVYIDRIVIAKPYRGLGLGRVFYADATSYAEMRVPLLACEVFLEPRDDVSLLFHGSYGFQEVGQRVMKKNGRRVSLLAKTLCSFPYVRDTYLNGPDGRLPDVAWLADRKRPVAAPAHAAVRLASGG